MALCHNYPGELVPEETFTHSPILIINHPLSASSIHNDPYIILPVQFTSLTVFLHNLCPSPLWSTSWSGTLHFILHTFLHPIILFFHNTCSYQGKCFAVVPRLCHLILVSLSTLLETLSFTLTPHIHLTILISDH